MEAYMPPQATVITSVKGHVAFDDGTYDVSLTCDDEGLWEAIVDCPDGRNAIDIRVLITGDNYGAMLVGAAQEARARGLREEPEG